MEKHVKQEIFDYLISSGEIKVMGRESKHDVRYYFINQLDQMVKSELEEQGIGAQLHIHADTLKLVIENAFNITEQRSINRIEIKTESERIKKIVGTVIMTCYKLLNN